jgi:transcriptional regulator with XRE-family HTH domain
VTTRDVVARLGGLIKAKRRESGQSLRYAAKESGVSPSTLSRLERFVPSSLPDADTLTKLASWLNMSVEFMLYGEEPEDGGASPEMSMPEFIEVHLRADKNLSSETADALSKMFKLLYNQLAGTGNPKGQAGSES